MEIIVITPPEIQNNEGEILTEMLRRGIWRVHLRHPEAEAAEVKAVLDAIPRELHRRVSLHDHFEIADGLTAFHLNRRNPLEPSGYSGTLSCSCHSILEAEQEARFKSYVTLSPIFDSISKSGYRGAFTPEQLAGLRAPNVVALGGITAERFEELKRYPFMGAALLGAVWQSEDPLIEIEKFL